MSRRRAGGVSGTSAALGAVALVVVGACNHAWDALDPLSSGSGSGGHHGTTGSGGSGVTATGASATGAGSGGYGGGGGAATSSSGSGGAAPAPCGHTDLLSWDCESDQPEVFDRDSQTDVSGGQGIIPLEAGASSYQGAAFTTIRAYDLRGDRVFAEITQIPDQPDGTYGGIELDYDNGDDLFLGVYGGKLECGFDHDGNESMPMQTPYDPVAHRWWQLREDQGTIHCETSPDGATWSDAGSFDVAPSLLDPPSAIRVQFVAETPDHVDDPGALAFDNLNGAAPPTGKWCKASSFTADFAQTSDLPGPAWDRDYDDNDDDSYDQLGDQLNFHWGSDSSNIGYGSTVAYDMTGERVTLQLVALPSPSPGDTYFSVSNDGDTDVFWIASDSGFKCGYDVDSHEHTIWQGQPPTLPAWVGLRESGGKIYCEILEGGMWKTYGSIGGTLDPTRVDVFMGAYAYGGSTPTNVVSAFDGYNLAPVP